MLTKLRRSIGNRLSDPLARLIAKTGISPNALTIIGFLLNVGVAVVVGYKLLFIGGFLLLFSGLFDMLDGSVARMTGKSSKYGAILDSTFDRLSEAAVLFGLLIFYAYQPTINMQGIILIFISTIGSFMISYMRARAEALEIKCEVGFFTRPERVILLSIGLIFSNILIYILWILAIGTNLTALWRLLYIRHKAVAPQSKDIKSQ